jgi:hypothetical protein
MNADLNTECYASPARSRLLLSIIGCDEYDGAMLKPIRLYAAVGLALTAIAIPAALTFADKTLTDTIRQARVTVCTNTFNLCANQCSARASSAPGSYPVCMQDCTQQYSRCINAISRGAPDGRSAGVTSHPSVAPPRPTPRKISPERVGGVSTTKATSTMSPEKSASSPTPVTTLRSSKASPTATPKPVKK